MLGESGNDLIIEPEVAVPSEAYMIGNERWDEIRRSYLAEQ
jgi:hypothetical protein